MSGLDNLGFENTPNNLQVASAVQKFAEVPLEEAPTKPPFSKRPPAPKKKPSLLSPQEQRALLDARRNKLSGPIKGQAKPLTVNLPLDMYRRLVNMAEAESMTGSFSHSFTYFVSWCMFAGLKYYETYGLTHNNPDKINFEEVTDATPTMPSLGHPSEVRRTLEESVKPTGGPIHPVLGRSIPRHSYSVPGGDALVPYNPEEDSDFEHEDDRPGMMRGEPAFDREALKESVRGLLPSSAG